MTPKRTLAVLAVTSGLLLATVGVAAAGTDEKEAPAPEQNCLAATLTGIAADPSAALAGTLADPGAAVTATSGCVTSLLGLG